MAWHAATNAWHNSLAAGTGDGRCTSHWAPAISTLLCRINIDILHKQLDEPCTKMIANSISIISHKSENKIVLDITISIVSEGPDYHWAALNLVYWTSVLRLLCLWVWLVWRKEQYKNSLQLVPYGRASRVFVSICAINSHIDHLLISVNSG